MRWISNSFDEADEEIFMTIMDIKDNLSLQPLQSIKIVSRFNLKTPQSGTSLPLEDQVKMTKRSPLSPLLLKAKVK